MSYHKKKNRLPTVKLSMPSVVTWMNVFIHHHSWCHQSINPMFHTNHSVWHHSILLHGLDSVTQSACVALSLSQQTGCTVYSEIWPPGHLGLDMGFTCLTNEDSKTQWPDPVSRSINNNDFNFFKLATLVSFSVYRLTLECSCPTFWWQISLDNWK